MENNRNGEKLKTKMWRCLLST